MGTIRANYKLFRTAQVGGMGSVVRGYLDRKDLILSSRTADLGVGWVSGKTSDFCRRIGVICDVACWLLAQE